MKIAFLSTVLLSLTGIALSKNIQIQALPPHVIYPENDLTILCSVTNPSQITSVYFIQLEKNSSTNFETVVSIYKDQTPRIHWPSGSTLQNRASATGSIDTPSSAQLRLTINKNSVDCPTDFTAYRCKMSGFSSAISNAVTQETNPITVTYTVNPKVIETPRVRKLGELYDTIDRQFPVATALQLTCEGQVGSDSSNTIRWCAKKALDSLFTGLAQIPIHSEASPSGYQYKRSSTITYNLTSTDTFTQFLCESGDNGLCGTGSAIQYVNISIALAQNIEIQALPQQVIYQENDLAILCSVTNPSQITSVYYIRLEKNSSADFETVVSIFKDQTPQIQWPSGSTLQGHASATGFIDTPSSAQLRIIINKNSVICPTDFTAYRCKMSGFSSSTSDTFTQETNPITVTYTVNPKVIQTPRVRKLGELYDTSDRQFPVATALQLTCEGQVGSDSSKTIKWCAKKASDLYFTELPQTPIHSEASPSGCQYRRSSTITYNLTSTDTFTQFLCESGDTGHCGTGSAIQYVNISIALAQNIEVQALPQQVIYQENDLTILCSVTNPSQINSIYFIQLEKNSSTNFETAVSIFKDQTPQIQWPSSGSTLQNRASATGSIDTPSSAQLRLTIDKNSVICPTDFTAYRCKMSGFSSAISNVFAQETNPITVTYTVNPKVIQTPRVTKLGNVYDTSDRQFPVATALQLTCEGQVGSDSSNTIRWCSKKASAFIFTGLAQTPIHSEASPSGCQYTRSSSITYNLTSTDTFTQFLCESGDTGHCGTGSAIQYVNISIETSDEGNPTTNTRTTDEGNPTTTTQTTDDTSGAGIIDGRVIEGLAVLFLIIGQAI